MTGRLETPSLSVERIPVPGDCPECGEPRLAAYPIFGEGGWWDVIKCQVCLASVQRTRGPLLGGYQPGGFKPL